MDFFAVAINALWGGLFAGAMAILFTAPPRYAAIAFVCGFAARLARDVLITWGVSQNWSTVLAAAVIVLVAVAIIRPHAASPVVLASGVLPLSAVLAMFDTIIGLMKVSSLKGEALSAASVALIANAGKVFTTTLAIVLGLAAGIAIVRFFRRNEVIEI